MMMRTYAVLLLMIFQIHVDKAFRCQTTTYSRKLMHRFTPEEVNALMDKVEKGNQA